MNYDLLIVGNGFDLSFYYRTSYSDFIKYIQSKGINKYLASFFSHAYDKNLIVNEEWNGFENILCQLLEFINYCFKNEDNIEYHFSEDYYFMGETIHRYFYWKIKDLSKIPSGVFLILCMPCSFDDLFSISIDNIFWHDFAGLNDYPSRKDLFFRALVNTNDVNSTREHVMHMILEKLDSMLKDLEKQLKQYIYIVTNRNPEKSNSFLNNTTKMIVSFNYSKTAQEMFDIDDSNIAYVHGNISTDVVLGVEPSMISNQSFDEESDFIKFFKRYRRIYKNCNGNYNNKIINKLTPESIVAIYGHSLDLSDKSILKPIFENKYKRYDIYCYEDVNSYKLKVAKLIGLDLFNDYMQDDRIRFILI